MRISKRSFLKHGLAVSAAAVVPSGIASIAFAEGPSININRPSNKVSNKCREARAALKAAKAIAKAASANEQKAIRLRNRAKTNLDKAIREQKLRSKRLKEAQAKLKKAEAGGSVAKIKAAQRGVDRAVTKSRDATNKEFAARKALKNAEKALKSATKVRVKADKAFRKAFDEEDHWCTPTEI
ncbi:MAG: hypothetical protein ACI8YI_002857 [Paracoccaceae bacterium]|jgi:hypothetical protein